MRFPALTALALVLPALALPASHGRFTSDAGAIASTSSSRLGSPTRQRRPVVVWHGLGDSAASEGMLSVKSDIEDLYPGIFVHNVYLSEDQGADRKAGFFGDVNQQVETVAAQLKEVPELKDGFSAIGFSQGGQFLRAYIELYNSPPVHTLVTFGSQHMGISDIPPCKPTDFICKLASSTARKGVYTPWAQSHLVQAQYYRDPNQMEAYLERNTFLALINNESPLTRQPHFGINLASLFRLVLLRFTNESTVNPPISSWFGSLGPDEFAPEGAKEIPMEEQELYKEDWIGLRRLDKEGKVERRWCEGEHMQIGGCWEEVLREFVGEWMDGDREDEEGVRLIVQE